jgi:UDP-N-acetylmuramoylalanine--D-glutamate ligase
MNESVECYFDSLRGKKIAVLGIGVSNRPLIKMLLSRGLQVTACDKTPREKLDPEVLELERAGAVLRVGEGYLDGVQADIVFRTPGMHPNIPALVGLREAGAEITSEMEIFFELCPCTIIGVTGSDGKTTTTMLIAKILEHAGRRVFVGGNIGSPLLPQVEQMNRDDIAVVELSSFQLMTMTSSPQIAVVTNLAPNHLDMHKDMAEYVAAKENIYLHQSKTGKLVVNMDNAITNSFAGKAKGSVEKFSRLGVPENGVYLKDGVVLRNGKKIMDAADIQIPGLHNVENYMAAACAVEGLASDADICAVARTFNGVEHRIELVRTLDGVKYYNDSIASSPSRTIAGLHSFRQKLILIAGGYDKHIPFAVLGPEICAHVKTLVLCGATADKIRKAVADAPEYREGFPEIVETDTLEKAVALAREHAAPGDIVTLSPACAAFDQFKNFMVRGERYKEIVNHLS